MYLAGGSIHKDQLTKIAFDGNKGLATYWINELILRGVITQKKKYYQIQRGSMEKIYKFK